jgi:hypothetical protein
MIHIRRKEEENEELSEAKFGWFWVTCHRDSYERLRP